MLRIRIIGDNILREKAEEVTEFDDQLKSLIDEMIETMHESDGIGLAAPQVGISKRLLVTDVTPVEAGNGPMAFINPVILESTGEVELEEGCLSIPGVRENVNRPEEILLKYQSVKGEAKTEKFTGWMSRVLQHEIDHLDGILFIDHLGMVKRKLILANLAV